MNKKNKKLFVLTYHKVENLDNFEIQMAYLKSNYNILDAQSIKAIFQNDKSLPSRNNLIITFDDGDISNYTGAFPILKKFKIPAIFFVITQLINSNQPFWWDEIEYYLGKQDGNKKVWEVKNWHNKKREAFLKDLRKTSNKPEFQYRQLTTNQLKEMQDAGIIIANHSHTHPMFDQCTNEELEWEMKNSTEKLKDLGFTPVLFAYPNGNYSPESEAVLIKHGIKQAFLFDHKINKKIINSLRISRLVVNDTIPLWKFKLILSGWHTRILPFTKAFGKLRK